jgi:hypothetical protein
MLDARVDVFYNQYPGFPFLNDRIGVFGEAGLRLEW